jgi:hypothetical protein
MGSAVWLIARQLDRTCVCTFSKDEFKYIYYMRVSALCFEVFRRKKITLVNWSNPCTRLMEL